MFLISNIKFFDYLYRKLRTYLYNFLSSIFSIKSKNQIKKDYSRVDILKILIFQNYLEIGCDLNQQKINLY